MLAIGRIRLLGDVPSIDLYSHGSGGSRAGIIDDEIRSGIRQPNVPISHDTLSSTGLGLFHLFEFLIDESSGPEPIVENGITVVVQFDIFFIFVETVAAASFLGKFFEFGGELFFTTGPVSVEFFG
jgi:hypothetical protein